MDAIKYEYLGPNHAAVKALPCETVLLAVLQRELAALLALQLLVNISMLKLVERFIHLGREDEVYLDLCGLH